MDGRTALERRGLRLAQGPARAKTSHAGLATATALMFAMVGALLSTAPSAAVQESGARLDVLSLATASGDIVVVVEAPGGELLADTNPGSLDGTLQLRLIDAAGAQVSAIDQPFALTLTGRVESFRATGLRYFAGFPKVDPGSYRVEVSLRAGAASGSGASGVVVPQPGEALLWPPMVAASDPRWLSYAQSVGEATTSDYPFVRSDGTQFVPKAVVRAVPGETTRLEIFAVGEGADLAELDLRVEGDAGRLEGVEFAPSAATPTAGQALYASAELRLPDVPLGAEFDVALVSGVSGVSGDRAPSTARLRVEEASERFAAQMPEPAAVALEDVEVDDNARRAAEQVVQRLADGEEERALATLLKASSGEDARPTPSESRKWRAAMLGVARRVAKEDPEAVLPIVLLQKLATEEHARHGRLSEGAQSVMTQRELAWLVIDRMKAKERAQQGADLLAVLGDYHGALELNPEHQFSLLRLAHEAEQHGHWLDATELLQRLAPLRPDDMSVLLRLGLGLARTERVDEGRRTLQAILSRPRIDSRVAVLAFEELGRLEKAGGRLRNALGVLERGQELFPEHQRLRLQLALCYEKLGRRVDAQRQLNRIAPTPPPASETPRSWYLHGPLDEIRRARQQFVEQARAELPRLAALRGSEVTP